MTDWPYPLAEVPSPQIVATWTQLGLVRTEMIPLWAAHWLVAGYDGDHLVYLAGLHGDDPWTPASSEQPHGPARGQGPCRPVRITRT